MNEIAAHAGVSRATVSLVLRESPLVADETRRKVLESADELGYVYNRAASGLRSQTSGAVGVVVTSVGNPFFSEVTTGIESVLAGSDRLVVLGQHSESLQQQDMLLNRLMGYQVDGIVLTAASGTPSSTIERLIDNGVAVVLLTRRVAGTEAGYVGPDNVAGAQSALAHLIQSNRVESLAFVGGSEVGSPHAERLSGALAATQEAGLSSESLTVLPSAPTRQAAYDSTLKLLAEHPEPLGIFAYNDIVAFGVTAAARTVGRTVGEDVLVVGFDDVEASRFERPPLTTVSIGTEGLGRAAAEALVDLIEGRGEPEDVLLGTSLVVRASCGSGVDMHPYSRSSDQ